MKWLALLLLLVGCGEGGELAIGEQCLVQGRVVACVYDPTNLGICACGQKTCGACFCTKPMGCARGDVGVLGEIDCR